jgi:hypothetical protein
MSAIQVEEKKKKRKKGKQTINVCLLLYVDSGHKQ